MSWWEDSPELLWPSSSLGTPWSCSRHHRGWACCIWASSAWPHTVPKRRCSVRVCQEHEWPCGCVDPLPRHYLRPAAGGKWKCWMRKSRLHLTFISSSSEGIPLMKCETTALTAVLVKVLWELWAKACWLTCNRNVAIWDSRLSAFLECLHSFQYSHLVSEWYKSKLSVTTSTVLWKGKMYKISIHRKYSLLCLNGHKI